MNFQDHSVLLVDKGASARQIHSSLQLLGFKRFWMAEALETAVTVASDRPSLAILNADAEGFQGIEFVRKIRHELREPSRRLPILVISSQANDDKKSRQAGANYCLAAPFALADLQRACELVVRDRRRFIVNRRYVGPDHRLRIDHDYGGPERRAEPVNSDS